jgi:hypothetical protein
LHKFTRNDFLVHAIVRETLFSCDLADHHAKSARGFQGNPGGEWGDISEEPLRISMDGGGIGWKLGGA